MKRLGFADVQLAQLRGETEQAVRERRWALGIRPVYKMVDTCAGEFPSNTPYLYSTYDEESEAPRSGRKSVVILGSGPNRIGQGSSSTTAACARRSRCASGATRRSWSTRIPRPSRPTGIRATSSISSRSRSSTCSRSSSASSRVGVIVQLGGQTPLKLTRPLEAAGVKILGTSPDSIDAAEDRRRFETIARELGVAAAAQRHGDERRRGGRGRDAHRLPRPRPAELRARRARDGDRVRRGDAARLLHARGARLGGPPGADRLVPRGRVRVRRRRHQRRRAGRDRRASCSTSRTPASTRATRRACCRRTR